MVTLIQVFSEKCSRFSETDRKRILEAANWAESLHREQKRASGEPYFIHPLKVAEIMVDMEMDSETVIAALLHDVLEDTQVTESEMQRRFGKSVQSLVDGVTKISIIKAKSKTVQQAETIRKMLFAMTKDIRVIIIKLADKLHNMKTLQYLPRQKRTAIATECLDIYAPLAERLGISWMKDELEDLALKSLHPDVYDQIKTYLAAKRSEREGYLEKMKRAILKAAAGEKLDIEVHTRVKHFYSIYVKMRRRKKELDEIYDMLGLRILCNTNYECYTLLGVVHRLWIPIDGRFKDYIAMPKANRYSSLHTTVMTYGGRLMEIQIRTHEMHRTAEYGVAAHWAYKQTHGRGQADPEELAIVTKLKSWNELQLASGDFLQEIKRELLKDTIYVFTPKGDIIELPRGSTPIDFAYHIHTEVGHHCFAAKADGVIVPLSSELNNTQVIEILTSQNARPHLNWLRYVRTAGARSKIRQWLNKHDDTLIVDRNIIAKPKSQQTASKPETENVEGEVVKQVIDRAKVAFRIGNERNMMISIARCCNPTTGDAIIGFVSRGRGIIVHKRKCPNLRHIPDFKERSIEVEWETVSPRSTRRFRVTARMTPDLFSEIEGAVRKYKGHLIEGKLEENEKGQLSGSFTMEIESKNDYRTIMKSIRTIPSVINIHSLED
jgi:GTP diphosphokinase / guanosine-3',5'-bis(diphosphate) 3'-diphosphatase